MANHGCINGSLDGVNYSSPVPVIGYYIAAASFLCVALMLYDTATGFLASKHWLPCKYFTLNSVTLTILSIVTKLPVDLTTSMPSRWDQISKLTGTAVICISMGFLAPSIGVNSESECLSNMVALSIFVITVAANICIQLYTGVIVLFFVEHIIILVMMLLLLLIMWHISLHIKSEKKLTTDQYNNLFKMGNGNMFGRLKLCHLYAYCSNPQFKISMNPSNATVSTICLACSGVVIQAAFRSLIFKKLSFCQSVSDYGRSMPYIVVAQLLTVIVGNFTILFRWLSLFSRMDLKSIISFFVKDDDMIQRNKTLIKWFSLQRLKMLIASLNMKVVSIAQLLIVWPSIILHRIPALHKEERLEFFNQLQPAEGLIPGLIPASPYIVQKSVNDIIRLSKHCNKEPLINLFKLLSKTKTSQHFNDSPHPMEISDQDLQIQVCSLSMALLIKIAQVSIPENHLGLLLNAFKEGKEIILFIDSIIQPKTSEDNDKFSYAEAVWTSGDFTCLVPHDIGAFPPDEPAARDHALKIMKGLLKDRSVSGNVRSQLGEVVDYINRKEYSSVEDLYTSIEELFVDMLHIILAQLPAAIFKSFNDSPAEEFEERVQLALKFLFKTGSLEKGFRSKKSLEKRIKWWFPKEYNISSFVTESESSKKSFTGALAKLEEAVPKVIDIEEVVPKGLDNEHMDGAEGV